jgi:hypothetical protein
MYRVTFRIGARVEGILIVEDNELNQTLKRADSDPDCDCEVEHIGSEEADSIPPEFIGEMLDENEAAELDRIMVACIPKKGPAPSVRRRATQTGRRA